MAQQSTLRGLMAAGIWSRLRKRIVARPTARDDGLRRVALRLAAQTVALVLVMLMALELVVYVITQQALLGTLETTIKQRANPPASFVAGIFHLQGNGYGSPGPGSQPSGGQHGPGGPGGPSGSGPGGPNPDQFPSEASVAFVSPKLSIVHADGALGNTLLIPQDVRQAVSTGQAECCSTHQYKGDDYLVDTNPLRVNGRIVGAAQSSISEHQYEQTMHSLLIALIAVALLGLLTSGGISAVLVRRALQPIRVAVRRQRDFVADAAHELRTPLAIMRTVGEVGMANPSADDLQATVAQMLGQNQHLTRLVDDLSLLARTDTNAVSIDRRPLDLSALAVDTAAELTYLAEEQRITLEADVQGDVRVTGDTLRLRQLLLILLDNAVKHTSEGGTIVVGLSGQGDRARLRVADSGPGIPPDELSRIFDRFYRADQSRTGEGSGLGLSIAKWIVEAHGGQIQAANTSPHGAVFTVTLPATRTPVQA